MAIEFGSPEAAKVLEADKKAAVEEVLKEIDWDSIGDNADVVPNNFHAKVELKFRGKTFRGEGDAFEHEKDAVDQAVEDIKWQVKMALKNGEIPLE